MRGKPKADVGDVETRRIIPAHAGQTACATSSEMSRSDHPRACGANILSKTHTDTQNGSSPRMRGKRKTLPFEWVPNRIIPAHAGQTVGHGRLLRRWPDHPRACGANETCHPCGVLERGSSPRMRGKHRLHVQVVRRVRIIPAHAGQTYQEEQSRLHPPDHPRACGANPAMMCKVMRVTGSSPRMRGKHVDYVINKANQRIIPAHAGQTYRLAQQMQTDKDHPRACGANLAALVFPALALGSSPRMRGKPPPNRMKFFPLRIIPAHAGQTSKVRRSVTHSPDHPRACGANGICGSCTTGEAGSSPRMRGKQRQVSRPHQLHRIIPAHAGQTSRRCRAR